MPRSAVADKLRLRQAAPAAIDLRRYWIERLEYEEADELPDALPKPSIRVSRPEIREGPPDTSEYLVTLRVLVSQGEDRSVDITIAGLFRLQDDEHQQATVTMLAFNGSAILFGAARGVIETVSGISGYGRMHVPSVNIAELLDR